MQALINREITFSELMGVLYSRSCRGVFVSSLEISVYLCNVYSCVLVRETQAGSKKKLLCSCVTAVPMSPSHAPWPHYAGQSINKGFNKRKTVLPQSSQTDEIIAPLKG